MNKLNGKVAVVTGASKGIGASIAEHLAAEGATVVVNYASSMTGADAVAARINQKGGRAIAIQGDVSKPEDIRRLFSEIEKVFGRVDVLVNRVVFEAVRNEDATNATLYVVPSEGGQWIRLTDGKFWDDKPRWSPDGKTIYFISSRAGSLNVWGIRFDPVKQLPLGEPFRVTAFENPNRRVADQMSYWGLSLTENRLVLPISEVSGSIWMLENVDR